MEKMVEYARKIAQYRKYPVLVGGLQPVEDYQVNGEWQPGLATKLEQKIADLRQAFFSWQKEEADEWDVAYEIANVYYYASQIGAQLGRVTYWQETYKGIRHYLPSKWGRREAEAAGDAKFGWRSEAAQNKDKEYEKRLIRERIESLPIVKRGRPFVHDEPREQVRGYTSQRFALFFAAMAQEEDVSKGELMEELIREHPRFQEFVERVQQEQHK